MATPNPQIPLEARQTVLDQIVAGASFTAYEITLEVRRRLGPTVEVAHPVVNTVVQTMFANGEMAGYDRAADTSVKAATPPLRYAPQGARGAVPAASVTPAVLAFNRATLPVNLRYSNPIAAIVREYGLEARAFHDAVGIGDRPFDVWLPTTQNPTFRVRSYGAALSESEVETRYSLSATSQSDFGSKAAFAYGNEFRITSFAGGKAKTFRAALDFALVGTVTKDGEVRSKQPDGMEIEIPVKAADVNLNFFGREAAPVFAFFRTPPQIQGGTLWVFKHAEVVFEGTGWKITRGGNSLVLMGDVALPINTTLSLAGTFSRLSAPVGVELSFAPDELDLSENGESLVYSDKTRAALEAAFLRVEQESPTSIGELIASAPDIWETKVRFSQLSNDLKDYLQRLQQKIKRTFQWKGVAIESNGFSAVDPNEATIISVSRAPFGTRLRTQKTSFVGAQKNTVVFFNDLNTKTGSPARMRAYFAAHPSVARAYVLTFVSEAARERFIADNNFQSVPVQFLSALPKPAATKTNSSGTTSRVAFDPTKHALQAPQNALAAAFETLDDAGFASLEKWAREVAFDGKNWPDFKRLYKQIETRVWPPENRFRWSKSEADVPPGSSLANEREAWLLGVLMGRLDSEEAKRGDNRLFPGGGPSAKTVAYLTRRAARLLRFLRDGKDLTSERQALLAPIAAGSMARQNCPDIGNTLVFRLGLQEDELKSRPDLVRRVWDEATLALPVLNWAFEWLRSRGETVEGQMLHVRRFAKTGEADVVLAILPALLQSGPQWARDYGPTDLANELQTGRGFLARRGEVLRVFARFPVLQARDEWVLRSLYTPEASEPGIVAFATPLVEAHARAGGLELVSQLSPPLREVFLEALVGVRLQGLSLREWQKVETNNLLAPLFPALQQMPMSLEVAGLLWAHAPLRAEFVRLGGEAQWVQAFRATIESNAKTENFEFALELPPAGRTLFFQTLGAGIARSTWRKLGALERGTLLIFAPDIARLPLDGEFWAFAADLDANGGQRWLDLVGRFRAITEFLKLSASSLYWLLASNASGLETLVEAWLNANASNVAGDDPLLLVTGTSLNENLRRPTLSRLREEPLNLRSALRLIESGLPEVQMIARPYFENQSDEWPMRALALADSPVAATRLYALDLLARFPERWTPALLKSLAEHDDARVQAFVAAQLERAPGVTQSDAVRAFDGAILNARGRSRQAKVGVQRRLETREGEETPQLEALLDAARNGAPRDRAWALQQLVRLQMSGADVPDLELTGAIARAS